MTVTPGSAPASYVGDVSVAEAAEAVRELTGRVASLLRSAKGGPAPVLAAWDVGDVAVHLSHAIDGIKEMARGTDSILTDIWQLPGLMEMLVVGEEQRDLSAVADRIEASVAEFLEVVESGGEGGADRAWLVEGTRMPLRTLLCHVLNELVVHGRDIAMAEGAAWPISRRHAALVWRGFLFPVLGALGRAMVNQGAAVGIRANYDIRLRGGGGAYLLFDDGDLTITSQRPRRIDCHLSVDPVAFMLVAWNRQSQWSGIARGQLFSWGRRPWLGLRLRSLMRNP